MILKVLTTDKQDTRAIIKSLTKGKRMKILLEQVITGKFAGVDTEQRITWIDSTIDNQIDAGHAFDAIKAFDNLMIDTGIFNDNDHMRLEINGKDIGYGQIGSSDALIVFLDGEVDI